MFLWWQSWIFPQSLLQSPLLHDDEQSSKEQHFFILEVFFNILNVTFNLFNASLLKDI